MERERKKRDDHKHITCSQPIPHTMGELAAALINKKKKKKKKSRGVRSALQKHQTA
jgi:hypothetical protein